MKDISLHLMDIVQNSIAAGASRITITIRTQNENGQLVFEIADNGKGMNPEFLEKVTDPFKTSRTTREVGLGIPLLKQSAEMAGGGLTIQSEPNKGTFLQAIFSVNHIDRIPLGDIPGTMTLLIVANPIISWNLRFSSSGREFELDTDEIREELNGVPLDHSDVIFWIQSTIDEGVKSVFGGVLDEVH